MALIQCPECLKEISDRAEACPNCGYPIFKTKPDSIIRVKVSTVANLSLRGTQQATILSGDDVLWEGEVGSIAELKIEEPTDVEIKYHPNIMHNGGSCIGCIDPKKGKRYRTVVFKSLFRNTIVLQSVDKFDE